MKTYARMEAVIGQALKKGKVSLALLLGLSALGGLFLPVAAEAQTIDPEKATMLERFGPPAGFQRISADEDSFAGYLRRIPLKSYGSPVLLFDGRTKRNSVHVSVFDIPLLKKDLIQCADAVIKLRAEHLYRQKRYDRIVFSLTNGTRVPFSRFVQGSRIRISGNEARWIEGNFRQGPTREVLEEYLEFIYSYAGTLSLSNEMRPVRVSDIRIGDVFVFGGSPGHAVLVADLAEDSQGKKVMLLAQSYMPSQEIHILKGFTAQSPWYPVEDTELVTPEWTFAPNSLRRFSEAAGP